MKYCGAKTRQGTTCRKPAMENGRCRYHGGLNPGAPKGNKNALKHGKYENITFNTLTEEELSLLEGRKYNDLIKVIDEQIMLMEVREMRMMKRVNKFEQGPDMVAVGSLKGIQGGKAVATVQEEANIKIVNDIEDALTRLTDKKNKLIELKHRIEMETGSSDIPDITPYIEALKGAQANVDWSVLGDGRSEDDEENE